MRRLTILTALLALPAAAQNTCYTGPTGTTICSTSGGVIHGNTNSVGNSVYRDDRGNRLDFQTDSRGTAELETRQGDAVNWNQPVLGDLKYPQTVERPIPDNRPHPASAREPLPLDSWLKNTQ